MRMQNQIPDYWIWMFWVSPLQYTLTGLANNEFLGDSYKGRGIYDGTEIAPDGVGALVLEQYQFMVGNKWRCAFYELFVAACLVRVPVPDSMCLARVGRTLRQTGVSSGCSGVHE